MTVAGRPFRRSAVGWADLVWAVADLPPAQAERVAARLGFVALEHEPAEEAAAPALKTQREADEPREREPAAPEPPPGAPSLPLWRMEKMTFAEVPDDQLGAEPAPAAGLTQADRESPGCHLLATPPSTPLTPWRRLWPVVRAALHEVVPGADVDTGALARAWSCGEVVARVPRCLRRVWTSRASIWIDRSARLVPFWSDQADLFRRIRRVCGRDGVERRVIDARSYHRAIDGVDLLRGYPIDPGRAVLVLGDIGTYGSAIDREAWLGTARRLRRAGVSIAAIVPCPPSRLGPAARAWSAEPWERGRHRVAGNDWEDRARRLLRIASLAAVVQPGLLRALRRLLPAALADASTEADAWSHQDVRAADPTGMELSPEAAARLRAELAGEDRALLARVSAAVATWHARLPREVLHAEALTWFALKVGAEAPADIGEAIAFTRRLAATLRQEPQHEGLLRYGRWLAEVLPPVAFDAAPDLHEVRAASLVGVEGARFPAGVDPATFYVGVRRPAAPLWWGVRQVGAAIVFSPAARGSEWPSYVEGPGSPMAWLLARVPVMWISTGAGEVQRQAVLAEGLTVPLEAGKVVRLCTDRCAVELAEWRREGWAAAAGRDEFGLWADAEVKGVVQRFRWIPPGRFLMGSPVAKTDRADWESPQRVVTWTHGCWLADTPVTQALWEAVMSNNPSRFRSADRPVEQVSWMDCERFIRRLNQARPGLAARLPGEAEGEHACRAGTQTDTWLGDLEIRGEHDAPLLDAIAWYAGNCGSAFDLVSGFPIKEWSEKQHLGEYGGTHAVKEKAANPFGIYDLLGNVWEWCRDRLYIGDGYPDGDVTNPRAPGIGAERVMRGGAWAGNVRSIRAASRGASDPARDDCDIGLRLSRSHLYEAETEATLESSTAYAWEETSRLMPRPPLVTESRPPDIAMSGGLDSPPLPTGTGGVPNPANDRHRSSLRWLLSEQYPSLDRMKSLIDEMVARADDRSEWEVDSEARGRRSDITTRKFRYRRPLPPVADNRGSIRRPREVPPLPGKRRKR